MESSLSPEVVSAMRILNALNENIFNKRAELEKVKAQAAAIQAEVTQLESQALGYMKELGQDKIVSPHGTVSRVEKWTWKLPADPDARTAFYEYLKGKGVFEQYVSVNYQSLQAFCNTELQNAKEAGDYGFTIPGLEEPKLYEHLQCRKSTKRGDV